MQESMISGPDRWLQIVNKLTLCLGAAGKKNLLDRFSGWEGPCVVSFVNAHAANLAWEDPDFFDHLMTSDLLLRDGIGMQILLFLLGKDPGENLNGTDLIPEILTSLPKTKRLGLYGTKEPFVSDGAVAIKKLGFETLFTENGFHDEEYYRQCMVRDRVDVVLLGMGMPKQEKVARILQDAAGDRQILIINGGAIIDFLSGHIPRAPLWLRQAGLEWFFRLCREPRRLSQRYLIGNAHFLYRAFLLKSGQSI